MKKHVLACWMCAVLTLCLAVRVSYGEDRPAPIVPKEKIALFNGKDLTGFSTWLSDTKTEDPRKVFTVAKDVDGAPAIHISGDGFGGIITDKDYANYRLVAEFRWGDRTWGARKDRTKDSGILLHCFGPIGNAGPWMASVECQLIEGGVGDFIVVRGKDADGKPLIPTMTCEVAKDRDGETIWKKGGEKKVFTRGRINWFGRDPDWKDVLGFRGKVDVESPGKEWTRVEVICNGDKITTMVNGVVVNEGSSIAPAAGRLQFQTEGAELYFRKIELHPLAGK